MSSWRQKGVTKWGRQGEGWRDGWIEEWVKERKGTGKTGIEGLSL